MVHREIRSFCQQAEAGQSLVVDNKARVIKVLKLPVDDQAKLPPVVGRLSATSSTNSTRTTP
jgi:hypothetical protein